MLRRAFAEEERGGGAIAGAVGFVTARIGCCIFLYDSVKLSIIVTEFIALALRLAATLTFWWPERLENDTGESFSST